MRLLPACLLLAGCDQLWNIDRLPDPSTLPDATIADVNVNALCPEGFTPIAETQTAYKYFATPKPWMNAKADCKALTTDTTGRRFVHLAVVGSLAEFNLVKPLTSGTTWVGGVDLILTDGRSGFSWITNEVDLIFPWDTAAGQPDMPDVQNCARIALARGIDDDYCNAAQEYLCECDGWADVL